MPIHVRSRRKATRTLLGELPEATLLDVTSKGAEPWVRFSPFFPHGGIPVPGRDDGRTAASVEGLWQGLKVFETTDVDESKFDVTTMSGLKRTVRRFGRVLGHRFGTDGLLGYADARRAIYLPAYRWMLEHRVADVVAELRDLAADGDIVLLDYETNTDVNDLSRPLSHAGLVKAYVEGDWPS